MKNFKFLLATTAILSMGAMAVNAEPIASTTLDVEAELIYDDVVNVIQNIKFGTFIANWQGAPNSITIDPETGNITDIDSNMLAGTHQRGEVEVIMGNSDPITLSIGSITLTNEDGDTATYTPDFAEIDSEAVNPTYTMKKYGIGGTVMYDKNSTQGTYTGTLTVNVVYAQ